MDTSKTINLNPGMRIHSLISIFLLGCYLCYRLIDGVQKYDVAILILMLILVVVMLSCCSKLIMDHGFVIFDHWVWKNKYSVMDISKIVVVDCGTLTLNYHDGIVFYLNNNKIKKKIIMDKDYIPLFVSYVKEKNSDVEIQE